MAQSLAETHASNDKRRLEMTFVDGEGRRQTISLPLGVACDLASVLQSLSAGVNNSDRMQFTRMPRLTAVGCARHERLVLIRFDDEPPYGLNVGDAETLWREVREEAEHVSRLKAPARQ
jgi:hypothetical protein